MNEFLRQQSFRDTANRYCADCSVALTYPNNTFASFLPLQHAKDFEQRWTHRNWISTKYGRNWVQMHECFAPKGVTPSTKCVKTTAKALAEFISHSRKERIYLQSIAHGVYICKTCAEIHCRLGSSVTKVKLLSDARCWPEGEHTEMEGRGNGHANYVLEHFMPREWIEKKTNHFTNKLEREVFIRKKYEILDFILPVHRSEFGKEKMLKKKKTATKKWKKLAVQTDRDVDWAIYTLAYKCYKERKDMKKMNITHSPLAFSQDVMRQLSSPVEDVVKHLIGPKTDKREVPFEAAQHAVHFLKDERRWKIELISYVVKIQSFIRMIQTKQRIFPYNPTLRLRDVLKKTIKIQTRTRSFLMSRNYSKKKRLTTYLQAHIRGYQHKMLYKLTRRLIMKIQAVTRGCITRRNLRGVMDARSSCYRKQIVKLWNRTNTPLVYRTKFWLHINSTGLTSFASQENELLRLWEILELDLTRSNRLSKIEEGENPMLANIVYAKFLHVGALLDSDSLVHSPKVAIYADYVKLERVQVYERLARNDDALNKSIYKQAGITNDEKMKKLKLAKYIWGDSDESGLMPEISTCIFDQLFPEIRETSNITPLMPSKKSLQRFGVQNTYSGEIPIPLSIEGGTMHLESNLDKQKIRNLADISRGYISGALKGNLSDDFESTETKNHTYDQSRFFMVHKYVHSL